MRPAFRLTRLVAVVSLAGTIAFAPVARADRGEGSIEVSFVGSSTLHDFEGTAKSLHVAMETQADGHWSAEVAVPVATLDTGIGARDEKLRAMLDATHHPDIHGRFRDVDAVEVQRSGVLPFVLRIREVERPVRAQLSHWQQDDRQARFDAEFDVSLADFGLEAPRVLLLRVQDTVHVTVHVTLRRS